MTTILIEHLPELSGAGRLERFWSQVEKGEGCWQWTGGVDDDGYGTFSARGVEGRRYQRAHRFSYWLATGRHPDDLMVCHRCDNPGCVRPDHLFLGTAADNNADMMAKGRQYFPEGDEHWTHRRPDRVPRGFRRPAEHVRHGEAAPRARLTQAQVEEIRERYAAGDITQRALAAEYGVSYQHISAIILRKFWKVSA